MDEIEEGSTTATQEEQEFADAWNDHPDTGAAPAGESTDETDTDGEQDPAVATQPATQATPATEPAPEPAAEPGRDAKDIAREKSWEGRLKAEEARLKADREELQRLQQQLNEQQERLKKGGDLPGASDPEEDPEIAQFRQEFDQVASPVEKLIDKRLKETVGPILDERRTREEAAELAARRAHKDAILAQHPDLDAILTGGHLDTYIAGLSPTRQRIALAIKQSGTADEANDLLTEFKEKTGYRTPDRDAARAVPTKRGESRVAVRTTAPDPNDYDRAWEEF